MDPKVISIVWVLLIQYACKSKQNPSLPPLKGAKLETICQRTYPPPPSTPLIANGWCVKVSCERHTGSGQLQATNHYQAQRHASLTAHATSYTYTITTHNYSLLHIIPIIYSSRSLTFIITKKQHRSL